MRHRPPGSGWSSRLLQDVLLLPTDAHSRAGVDYAKRQYAARRSAMLEALTQRDVAARGRDGTNLRVTVRNEQEASVSLALNGIAWRPGPRSCPRPYARSSARCLAPPTGPRRRHRQQDPPRGQRHPSSLTTRHCQGPGPTHLPPPGRAVCGLSAHHRAARAETGFSIAGFARAPAWVGVLLAMDRRRLGPAEDDRHRPRSRSSFQP